MTEIQWRKDLMFQDIPDEDEFTLHVPLNCIAAGECDAFDGELVKTRRTNCLLRDLIDDILNSGFSASINEDKTKVRLSYTFKFK